MNTFSLVTHALAKTEGDPSKDGLDDRTITAGRVLAAVQVVVDALTPPDGGRYIVGFADIGTAQTQLGERRITISSKPLRDASLTLVEKAVVLATFAAHEIGHTLVTGPRRDLVQAHNPVSGYHMVTNLADDIVLEPVMVDRYPILADAFEFTGLWVLRTTAQQPLPKTYQMSRKMTTPDRFNVLLNATRYGDIPEIVWADAATEAERDWCRAWAGRLLAAPVNDHTTFLALCDEAWLRIRTEPDVPEDEPEPEPEPGDEPGEDEDEDDEPGESEDGGQGGMPDDDEPGDEPDGDEPGDGPSDEDGEDEGEGGSEESDEGDEPGEGDDATDGGDDATDGESDEGDSGEDSDEGSDGDGEGSDEGSDGDGEDGDEPEAGDGEGDANDQPSDWDDDDDDESEDESEGTSGSGSDEDFGDDTTEQGDDTTEVVDETDGDITPGDDDDDPERGGGGNPDAHVRDEDDFNKRDVEETTHEQAERDPRDWEARSEEDRVRSYANTTVTAFGTHGNMSTEWS